MTSPAPAGSSSLPLARVKTIMKSSPDVESVTQESLFLVTKATVSCSISWCVIRGTEIRLSPELWKLYGIWDRWILCASTVSLGKLFDWKKLFNNIWYLFCYSVANRVETGQPICFAFKTNIFLKLNNVKHWSLM